jgi:hypothetical protein
MIFSLWTWALSSTCTSTPAPMRAPARSSTSPVTPMAAAH